MAGYSVTISAVDQATGVINRVNTGLEHMGRRAAVARAPFERFNRAVQQLGQNTGISRIGSDVAGLSQQIVGFAASLGRFAPALGAITGAASIAGLAALVTRWTEFGSRLGLDAQRIGVTADSLNRMQGAARLAGSSAEALTGGMQALRDNLVNAAAGRSPETVQMLAQLGISLRDASGHARTASDVMPLVADKITRLHDPTEQAMVATALFGSAGENLLLFLRRGAQGIADYNTAAERYGLVSGRGVEAANQLREAQARVQLAVEGLGNAMAERVAPVLLPMLNQLSEWIVTHRDEIAGFFTRVSTAIGGWTEAGGITRFIEGLERAYNCLKRIVEIADAVGHAARKMWDGAGGAPAVDEFGRPIPGAGPTTPAGLPQSPTVAANGGPNLLQRILPTWLGGQTAYPPPGSYDHSTPLERIQAGIALGTGMPRPSSAEQVRLGMAAMDQLVGLGRSPAEAAGIVASFGQESGFNVGAVGDGGAARGLVQWHPARQAAIERQFGKRLSDMSFEEQVAAAHWELRNREIAADKALGRSKTGAEAGAVVSRLYERPADVEGEAARRAQLATGWEARWNALHPAATVAAAPVQPVPTAAAPGQPGAPGPNGNATVRLSFDNPPAGMQARTVSTGGLRIETPALGSVP